MTDMELFIQERTLHTPDIYGSVEKGLIKIQGICRPENAIEYFRDFISWMKYFNMVTTANILVEIDLEYMNTSSGMILYKILSGIKSKLNSGQKLMIVWRYDQQDQDMKMVGEDFQYMLGEVFKVEAA